MTPTDVLESLNPKQREAVLCEKGPLLILAGAGSGKTRTITHRMAHLIRQGCPADGILAITFTNKAAGEMQERTERLVGARSPWVSTFHSFCARILRRNIHRMPPYDNSFTIYDADDCRALLKDILDGVGVDKALWTPQSAQAEISRAKNSTQNSFEGMSLRFAKGHALSRILDAYVEAMRERNAVDFDDLLLLTVQLFETHPDVLARYQAQFQHVLIDEFQDTNAVQYRIGRHLASSHRNICITGDPDQSIYSWRGADISNILNFEHDYPEARVVLLDQNYRSTQRILDAANALISHNRFRKDKDLWSSNGPGEPVRIYQFADETEEASEVASLVRGLIDHGTPPRDIAVFYRINALSRPIEQGLIHKSIAYSVVGGIAFFLRKEVKDVLGYLRILDNPRDEESLKRIINIPARGIGKSTVQKLAQSARSGGQSLLDYLMSGAWRKTLSRKSASAVEGFVEVCSALRAKRQGAIADLIQSTLQLTRYEEHLRETAGEGASDDLENVWQLHNAASEYDTKHPDGTLTGFLETVNLLGDVDRWQRAEDRVTLMTLHSAKGLEFPVVVIIGVEDGIVPLERAGDSEPQDDEEERRLLYVGVTRAQEQLFLTHAASRRRFGRLRSAYPSRFLNGLRYRHDSASTPNDAVEWDENTQDGLNFQQDYPSDEVEDFEEDPYPVGSRVFHADYGEGVVRRKSGIGRKQRVVVEFEEAGEKQFVLGYGKLRRL